MRSKSIVLLALALGCGLVAAIGIGQMLDARRTGADMGNRQPVFVAMADIGPNEELTAQNIKLEEWPQAIVPAGALTRLEDVEGRRSRMKIYAGEPVLSSKLLGPDETIGAAKDIPPGYRVAHVTIDSSAGSNNLILPGDRVDVLVYRNIGQSNMRATASKIVLQDIKVFAVNTDTENEFSKNRDDQNEPMTAKTISLLVTPRQSEILHAATEMSGGIRLVLRNPEDDAHYASEGATIADIFGPDERTDRGSETGDSDRDNLTDWLSGQQDSQQSPPPVPPMPQPNGPRKSMVVMYGSELMQVDFPVDGSLPTNPFRQDGGFNPSFAPGSQLTGGAGGGGAMGGPGAMPPAPGGAAPADGEQPPGEFIEHAPTENENPQEQPAPSR